MAHLKCVFGLTWIFVCLMGSVGSKDPDPEDTLRKALTTHWKYYDPCIWNVKKNVTKADETQFHEIIKGMKPPHMHDYIECTADQLFVLTVLLQKQQYPKVSWLTTVIEMADQPPAGLDKVVLSKVDITNLYYNTYSHKPMFSGTLTLEWIDKNIANALDKSDYDPIDDIRRKIDKDGWSFAYHSWYPKLERRQGEGQIGMSTRRDWGRHRVTNYDNGQSEALILIGAGWWTNHEIECDAKYDNFPFDIHTCTFDILMAEKVMTDVQLRLANGLNQKNVKMDPKKAKSQPHWHPVAGSASVTKVIRPNKQQGIKITYQMMRWSSTIVAETVLPLVLVTCLVVVVPLFLQWTLQMVIKLLGTMVYIYLLQSLMRSFPDINNGSTTPRIVQAYDFLIYTTGVSAIVTLVLYSLSKMERILPPPHSLRNVTSMINTVLCCTLKKEKTKSLIEDGKNQMGANSGQQDWEDIFQGINNIFLVMFTCIYVLGVIILGT